MDQPSFGAGSRRWNLSQREREPLFTVWQAGWGK